MGILQKESNWQINLNQLKNKLDFIRDNLVTNVFVPLSITDEMFLNNTFIVDGIWSLKELLDKSGISI